MYRTCCGWAEPISYFSIVHETSIYKKKSGLNKGVIR